VVLQRALAALVVPVLLAVAAPAWAGPARWTVPAAGDGSARALSLTAPASVTASCSLLLPSGVELAWHAGATPVPGTTYTVQRSSDGGGTWTTLAVGAVSPVLDAPGVHGTYRYRVTARAGGWSQTAASAPRTITLALLCV
jgi:hypothetical protein